MLAGHTANLVVAGRARPVEGDHMVDLGADADAFANFVVVVAGHMGHDGLTTVKSKGVQKL